MTKFDKDANVIENINAHLKQGTYLSALELGEEAWGEHTTWKTPERLICKGRIFMSLGFRRYAFAIRLRAYRRFPTHPKLIYYYVSTIFQRQGALKALQLINQFGDLDTQDTNLLAEWFSQKADVYGQYRDWDTANHYMQKALNLSPDNNWIKFNQATLYEAQDLYDKAMKEVEPLAKQGFRAAIQYKAHLLSLKDKSLEAVDFLLPWLKQFQGIGLALQLFYLCTETNQWDRAKESLDFAKQLMILQDGTQEQSLHIAEFELAYQNNDIETAKKALTYIRSSFYKDIAKNLEVVSNTPNKRLLDVPFIRQHSMTCAPATITALSKYWKKAADHMEIVEAICYDGTPNHSERRWAIEQGWKIREFELTPDICFALIDRDIPFTLSTVHPGSAHMQAIVGYDKRRGTYLVRDPYHPEIQEFLIDKTGKYCASSGPRCLMIIPADEESKLQGLTFPSEEFYDLNYELIAALEKHDIAQANVNLETMQQLDTNHRMCITAEITLARYNKDLLAELSLTERLLELYPNDLNLQSDKGYILSKLGRHQEQIKFLEAQVAKEAKPHPFIVQELVYGLKLDHRNFKKTQRHLSYLLRKQPTDAKALWTLAGVLWDETRYQEALEYYRLCMTLQDKTEGYVSSYFKASRYLNKTDEALTLLDKRIEKLGDKSSLPWLTKIQANRALSLDHLNIDCLLEAQKRHPTDVAILTELVDEYLESGQAEAAEKVLNNHQGDLSKQQYLSKSVSIAEYRNDWKEALSLNQQLLEINSLDYEVINSQQHLLAQHYNDAATVDFLDVCLEKHPNDRSLMLDRLYWMRGLAVEEQISYAKTVTRAHSRYDPTWVKLGRLQINALNYDAAHKSLTTALQIDPLDITTQLTMGDLYKAQRDFSQALDWYYKILNKNADTENLFSRILECSSTLSDKQAALDRIEEQLLRQTSYGTGLLDYQETARSVIEDEELKDFLEKAVKQRPDLWHSWAALIIQLKTMNELPAAIEVADQAVERYPLLPRLRFERANTYYFASDFEKAEKDLYEVLKITPKWPKAITLLANTLENQSKYEEAYQLMLRSTQASPNTANYYGYLADYYLNTNQTEGAITALKKAISLEEDYNWAWTKLSNISGNESCYKLAKDLLEEKPENVTLLHTFAEFSDDTDEKLTALNKALTIEPLNEDVNLELASTWYLADKITEIEQLLKHEKWHGHPPTSLSAYIARVKYQYHHHDEAIKIMEALTSEQPDYYDGWKYLSNWYMEQNQASKAFDAIDRYVRLYPHSPEVLVNAAEAYLEAETLGVKCDHDKVNQYFTKAVTLDPRNDRNGILWIDYLSSRNDKETLIEAEKLIEFANDSPYHIQRRLKISLICHQSLKQALEWFEKLALHPKTNDWLANDTFLAFKNYDKDAPQTLAGVIEEYFPREDLNPFIGIIWAECALYLSKDKASLTKWIDKLSPKTAFWQETLDVLLERDKYKGDIFELIEHYAEDLKQNDRTWALVTLHFAHNDKTKKLLAWCADSWDKGDKQAWGIYLYSFELRWQGQWKKACQVNDYATTKPEDGYYDRVLVWKMLDDLLRNDSPIDDNALLRIRCDELAPFENHVYKILQQLQQVQREGNPSFDQLTEYKKALKLTEWGAANYAETTIDKDVRKRVRKYIINKLEGSYLQTLRRRLHIYTYG